MNKCQEAIKELTDFVHSELDGTKMLNEHIDYIETIKKFVDKAYSNCFPVYINGTCPYHNQNIPTLEEVKKEWRKAGYSWKEYFDSQNVKTIKISRYVSTTKWGKVSFEIFIYVDFKKYSIVGEMDMEEHQLLTKTFKALEVKE